MVKNSFVFCFIFFLLVFFGQETDALKKGDVGTCVGKESSIVKKQVPYWVTGRCRNSPKNICRARRWKTVPSLKWTTGTICCEGWQHDGEQDACKPVCSIGCLNGRCTAPETCHCDPPLYLDPARNNICLAPPTCKDPCVNAICVNKPNELTREQGDSICECINGTRRYNDTHCANCEEGFKINPDLTCSPVCDSPCVKSVCVAPNKCQCIDGYRLKDGVCQPHCDICDNSECVEPNKCKCLPGFTVVNDTHCRCDCENGECVSGECVCHDGYRLVEGVCEPVCDSCVNGLCVAPGECVCYEGHAKSNVRGVCCRPECGAVCDDDGECVKRTCAPRTRVVIPNCNPAHQRCVQFISQPKMICCKHWKYNTKEDRCEPICKSRCVNGICVAPDTCSCLPGYIEHNDTTCIPNCGTPCNNGVCTNPNQCTCYPNYQLDPTDKFNCQPICEPKCVNASCSLPNTCSCNPGYEPENSWQCKPVCDSCQNGQCIGPNNCRCNDGYAKNDGVCVPVCDEPCLNGYCSEPNVCTCRTGFKLNAVNKFVCDPICEPACVNSKCVSPNKCSCDSGYVEIESDWKCKSVCDSCDNGECTTPNNCSCNEVRMYRLKQNGTCLPICNQPCINGYCSKPNECSCNDGFKLNPHNKFTCVPICEPDCVNARCVSPNVCFCDAGYGPENKWKCKPICDSCDNGICVAPNTCSCNEGYTMEAGRCVPVCKSCLNGRCVAPNKCECFTGFELNTTTSQCDPVCNPDCINAKCVSPNQCRCFEGYREIKELSACLPICESCEHGTCVAPGKCECKEGYSRINGKCSPVCIDSCLNGHCTAPNICTCIDGFVKKEGRDNVCYRPCDSPCENGYCNDYGMCVCHTGFEMYNDTCQPIEQVDCDSCEGNCTAKETCQCTDGRPCYISLPSSEEITTSASLAGLEWSWMLGGAVGILLITLMLVVIQRTWARRTRDEKAMDNQKGVGSVVYHTVVPDTLISSRIPEDGEEQVDYYSDTTKDPHAEVQDSLLGTRVDIEDEHL